MLLAAMLVLSSCISDDDEYTHGVWDERADLDGPPRGYALSFTIGNYGYLFGGYGSKTSLNDLWRYNIEENGWVEMAQNAAVVPPKRHWAMGFALNGKLYVTTGAVRYQTDYLSDTWEYDPSTDSWTQMDDFPGGERYGGLGFALGNYGYAGCGKDIDKNYMKDIYRFDPTASPGNQWTRVDNVPFKKRVFSTTWVYNNEAYIVCGANNSVCCEDFYKFDGTTWTQLRDIADNDDDEDFDDDYDIIRSQAVALVIDDLIYLVGGNGSEDSGTNYRDYWIYIPSTDLWKNEDKYDYTPFEGGTRTGCSSFSTGTRGFVLCGMSGTNQCDDMYELLPYELEDN